MIEKFTPVSGAYSLLIGGQETHSVSGKTFESFDPSTGLVLARFHDADETDVDAAVDAAKCAYNGVWGQMTPKDRSRHLFRWASAIRDRQSDIAWAETLDVGRPISLTENEMGGLADSVEYYAGLLLGLGGETLNISDTTLMDFTLRESLGVCALITPWNYPALIAVLKMAPALAAGNTVVLKPSELTPLSSALLGEAALAAGMPDGVINIVHGGGIAGNRLVQHPDVAKISFTGGTQTGKKIIVEAAASVKKLTLELGGKSPLIVFDDANLDSAVDAAFTDNVRNSGQVCAACTRLIVQDGIHDEFVAELEKRLRSVRIGQASDEETDMGPVVSKTQRDWILSCLKQAETEGAQARSYVDIKDRRELQNGYFVPPALLINSNNNMETARTEIFGPVQSVIRFSDEDQANSIANDSEFGLAAAVFTRDTGRAMRSVRAIQAGTVCVNTGRKVSVDAPFGGYGQSGLGKERGIAAMLDDTQIKNVRFSMI